MAIKFVDKEPEGEPKPKTGPAPQLAAERPAEDIQPDPPGGILDGQLRFAKTEPKERGRKKPLK